MTQAACRTATLPKQLKLSDSYIVGSTHYQLQRPVAHYHHEQRPVHGHIDRGQPSTHSL